MVVGLVVGWVILGGVEVGETVDGSGLVGSDKEISKMIQKFWAFIRIHTRE